MVNPDKRRRIIRSALEVISEKGFHAAPMAMIADHAGVASGTIYDFFKSKDVLIAEVYQDIVERIYPVLLKEYQTGKTIRDCYLLVCTALLKHFMRNRYDLGYLEQYHESVLASEPFIRREVEYRRKDGTPFLGNIYMRAARDQNGRLQFFEGFVEDITERKRVYDLTRNLNLELEQRVKKRTLELEKANEALQQEVEFRKRAQVEITCLNEGLVRQRAALEAANNELETFSYSVSHDLRAPLRHIITFVSIFVEDFGPSLSEKAREYLQKIEVCGLKMQELIDGLLSLSRVSGEDIKAVALDLSIYGREIAQELQQAEPQRDVTFVIADRAPALADPVLIRSVLDNLLRNAWKYSSKREKSVIEFGCEEQEGGQVFFVRDNGAGFDMAYADKLFGVFQRMHSASEFEGTGIGLATVQRIIHRHGGAIWAEAGVDKGATFFFTLPPA